MKFTKINLTNAYQALSFEFLAAPSPVYGTKISIYPSVANTGTLSLALSATPGTNDIVSLGNGQGLSIDTVNGFQPIYAKSSLASGDILYIVEN